MQQVATTLSGVLSNAMTQDSILSAIDNLTNKGQIHYVTYCSACREIKGVTKVTRYKVQDCEYSALSSVKNRGFEVGACKGYTHVKGHLYSSNKTGKLILRINVSTAQDTFYDIDGNLLDANTVKAQIDAKRAGNKAVYGSNFRSFDVEKIIAIA
jgi:hypothetical protein